jgi:hypothetical protein
MHVASWVCLSLILREERVAQLRIKAKVISSAFKTFSESSLPDAWSPLYMKNPSERTYLIIYGPTLSFHIIQQQPVAPKLGSHSAGHTARGSLLRYA